MCTESRGFWIWKNCDRTGTKEFKIWKKPDSNPYLENRHINFKLSKLDQRLSQKGRAGQHWLKPMTYFEVASKLYICKCSLCRWPKCEHIILFFTFSELKISKFSNVNTLRAHQIVPFQTQMFSNGLNFQQQNPLQNQCLALKIVKLNSILLNLTHRGLSKNTKNALKFQYS